MFMVGVLSTGGYLIYQEFLKLGPPSQPVSASAASTQEGSGSSAAPIDPNDHLLVVGNGKRAFLRNLRWICRNMRASRWTASCCLS